MQDKLDEVLKKIDEIKGMIFDEAFDDGVVEMVAKFEFLQGMGLIDAAAMCFRKSQVIQARALAESPRRCWPG